MPDNGEFDIIRRYFSASTRQPRRDVLLSVGDDCAITEIKPNRRLALTTDTLVEGTHFLPSISAADLAYKAVAVNLSDLAAMGAEPAWISLALTLPKIDEQWLSEFSQSLFQILDHYNVDLIGGDTTKGTLSLTITAHGLVAKDKILCRHTAKPGDWIYVSGTLGDSAAGLQLLLQQSKIENDDQRYLLQRHLRPTPRVLMGMELAGIANAAIDLSDGLISDLQHILERSQCGAVIELDKLPLSKPLLNQFSLEQAQKFALAGGEDYELCFTVAEAMRAKMEQTLRYLDVEYHCIGQIRANQQLQFTQYSQPIEVAVTHGFDHFK
ncbi:thiamine monophosphate kinase [Gallibacterium genomosp. 2]|uniref:Thiamine-monophosphate kinase n=2 Tax=Gallibacterium TaxID=155493 RepID=A0A0A2XGH8_9PAST|nr:MULTISPECIES: thiamine-phosphate kinase [Gallibacterium]KGQ29730.1 thiamine monophosphate kinase [Gallibacterium genomosp. 2]MDK9429528.1 thiamine-phosphate kinase [Gallibacterium anatis]WIM80377.1 thiamine-phosphate kinase [Gallibacterium anatis]